MRLIDFFDRGCEVAPDRDCFVEGGRRVTYREARVHSHRLGIALHRAGLTPGVRAAVLGPNSLETCLAILGVLRAGLVWVPINHRNAMPESAEILGLTECECLLYSARYADQLPQLRRRVPSLRTVICLDDDAPAAPSMDTLVADVDPAETLDVNAAALDVSRMPTTGGTTGRPKAAVRTHLSDATLVASFLATMRFDAPPTYLLAAPVSHAAGGMTFPYLALGGTVVMIDRPEPLETMRSIERYRVNSLFLPPTAIYSLLSHPDVRKHDYSSLRYFYYGAAPMSVDKLIEAIDVFGPVLTQLFGQTEAPIIATYFSPEEHVQALSDPSARRRLASVGRAGPFARVAVMAEDGVLLGPEQTGEIVIRSNLAIREYYRSPEETARLFHDGWVRTGDIGLIDADGYVYLLDRRKDVIITGGFNVYPSEVERVLWAHPAVRDCAVVGAPDPKWGEAVTAVVELKEGQGVDVAELIALCRTQLGGVKAPKRLEVWPSLPRSPAGKVLKRAVRDHFWGDAPRRI